MDQIDPDALYDERGTVSLCRPILQGDVFEAVALPGFDDEPMKVQVVDHPCAMRRGPNLSPRITVALVGTHPKVDGENGWNGNLRVMPMPELISGSNYATRFTDLTAVPVALLQREQRIASLSNRGIYVLQQRLIKHYTRLDIPLDMLRTQSAPVLHEATLQWDWLEEVLTEPEQMDTTAIDVEAAVFQQWLDDAPQPTRRERMQDETHHPDLQREATRAARERGVQRQQV